MSKAFSSRNVAQKFAEVLPMLLDKLLPMSVLTEGVGPYGDVRENALPVLGAEGNKIGTGAAVIVLLQPQSFSFR